MEARRFMGCEGSQIVDETTKESSGAVLISLREKLNPDTCNLTQILLLP